MRWWTRFPACVQTVANGLAAQPLYLRCGIPKLGGMRTLPSSHLTFTLCPGALPEAAPDRIHHPPDRHFRLCRQPLVMHEHVAVLTAALYVRLQRCREPLAPSPNLIGTERARDLYSGDQPVSVNS